MRIRHPNEAPRLTALKPRIAAAPPRVRPPPKEADPIYRSREWRELVGRLKDERGHTCERCGREGASIRIYGDHRQELQDGGAALDETNVALLCARCHVTKTNAERARRMATRFRR